MKIRRLGGTVPGKKTTGWFIDFYNQWPALLNPFEKSNWYDFTLINIGGEFAPYTGRWELELALLGFKWVIQYVYDDTFNLEMDERVKECMEEHQAKGDDDADRQ